MAGGGGDTGSGGRMKAGAAGGGDGALLRAGSDGALARPASSQDKSVDTIVARVQEKLAGTGNDSISSPELRAMVISAAKTTTSDTDFLLKLNVSIADRLTASQAATAGSPVSTLQNRPTLTTSPSIGITKPSISGPSIGTKETPVIKKTP